MARTIIEKLWDEHSVADLGDGSHLIYIDRVFFHERTGSIALKGLEATGRKVRNPEQVFGCMDHIVDTIPGRTDRTMVPGGTAFITETRDAAIAAGVHLFDLGDERQGIVHVVSPEQGIAVPGVTLVCPDSHTCTQGALGALAWGIGSTEAEHAMATKTLVVKKPKLMRVRFDGRPGNGVTAKDLILHLIGEYTASGGVGYAIEFAGEAIRAMPMEARFTLCNMAVEFGAWTGIIAPDETTYEYSEGRPFAPQGELWERAVAHWRTLPTDDDAVFDRDIIID
ncbi:MAG: 3-isopropylmalate dehydratase, partial [Gammaproteobacteria bacterium]|nr:3-isopropylmalate dehydratase [Gammaproteobacteria bacterium]